MKIPLGVRYMLLATLAFGLMKVFVKYIPSIPTIEIVFFRAIISMILSLVYLLPKKIAVFGNNKGLLAARGLVGAIALILNYYLLHEIPLATASILTNLTPIFTTLIGIYLLKEKIYIVQIGFFALSFVGIFIIQGFDTRVSGLHLFLGILASFFSGIAYNLVRKLSSTEHPLVIMFYFPLVVLPISLMGSLWFWVNPEGWDWFNLLMVGVTTQVAQYFMTKSYQQARVSKVAIFDYLGVVYALIFGLILFNEYFNVLTYLGIALVLIGIILNFKFKLKEY
jgi:drug/metabolite transporter (DMT)-like permease